MMKSEKKAMHIFFSLILICLLISTAAADTDSLFVDTNGNIGIGTTSPDTVLTIRQSNPVLTIENINCEYDSGGVLRFGHDQGGNKTPIGEIRGELYSGSSNRTGAISFWTSNAGALSERMRINNNGYIGIGTTSPDTALTIRKSNPVLTIENINSNYDSGGVLRFGHDQGGNKTPIGEIRGELYNGSSNRTGAISFWTSNAGALSERMRIKNNGYIGIGTATPEFMLDVFGDIRANNHAPSDVRWKKDINRIEDGLDLVTQLRGVSYSWIDPSRGEGRQIGVIAQEVEKVMPEVVHTDSQGYKSVEYAKLVAPLIEAVKELKAENDSLKAELRQREDELEKRLEAIEDRLAD